MIAQRLLRDTTILVAALVLAACAAQPPEDLASPGSRAAAIALDQVGSPYRYGGSNPSGFDCSGLVHFAYGQAGLRVPRTTGALWSAAQAVDERDLRAGDLLFFRIEGKMSHVGLYLGERRFVHAPQSGRRVSVASLDAPFYRKALIRAGRVY